jgi:hypothetical protein
MLFSGFYGIVVGLAILSLIWMVSLWTTKGIAFEFDAHGAKGAFATLLHTYLDIAKFVLGLAGGSIVLLVGSSSFRSNGRLPAGFASPLFLLVLSILYGILFMVFLVVNYEEYSHNPASYTRHRYARNQALGYGALCCFCVGYAWLILAVAT